MLIELAVAALALLGPGETTKANPPATLADRDDSRPSLSLERAVETAVARNPARLAAAASGDIGDARRRQARATYFPRVDLSYSASRSDNPVMVFGQKLSQGRFTESDFAIASLNEPDAIANYQAWLGVTQTIWDGGRRSLAMRDADLGREIATESERQVVMQLVFNTTRTYFAIRLLEAQLDVFDGALATTSANIERAEARVAAGLATEADSLALQVRRATLDTHRIQTLSELTLTEAGLNRLMAQPLDRAWTLTTELSDDDDVGASDPGDDPLSDGQIAPAGDLRPDLRRARAAVEIARIATRRAGSRWWPRVDLHAAQMWDRDSPFGDGSGSYSVGLTVGLNLFDGLADAARTAEATAALAMHSASYDEMLAGAQLEIRSAQLDRRVARRQLVAAEAAIRAAVEGHRIVEHRFEAGLAEVTELLRSENDVVAARSGRLQALFARRVAEAHLELALGSLAPDPDSAAGRSEGRER